MTLARAALALSCLAACQFDGRARPGVLITCNGNEQCPTDWLCDGRLGICVANQRPDVTPPTIVPGSIVITPSAARAGSTVKIAFSSDEDLLRPCRPEITDATGVTRAPMVDEQASTGSSCQFSLEIGDQATISEGTATIIAELVDRWGNISPRASVGSFTIDREAPRVLRSEVKILTNPTDPPPIVVSALKPGHRAVISVLFSEIVDPDSLRLVPAAVPLALRPLVGVSPGPRLGNTVDFYVDLMQSPGLDDQLGGFEVGATDLAGNPVSAALAPDLRLDTSPPAPIDVSRPDGVLLRWNARSSSLEGAAGLVRAGDWVEARSAMAANSWQTLVTDAGFLFPALGALSAPDLEVRALDSAGNASEARRVQWVEWTASSDEPRGQRTSREIDLGALVQPADLPLPSTGVRTIVGADSFVRRLPIAPIASVFSADTWRRRVVAVGNPSTAVWEWDGVTWSKVGTHLVAGTTEFPSFPAGSGPSGSAFAFDERRGVHLLVRTSSDFPPVTWQYDGRAKTWQRLGATIRAFSFQSLEPQLVWNPRRKRLWLTVVEDQQLSVWEFDDGNWRELLRAPSARLFTVFDEWAGEWKAWTSQGELLSIPDGGLRSVADVIPANTTSIAFDRFAGVVALARPSSGLTTLYLRDGGGWTGLADFPGSSTPDLTIDPDGRAMLLTTATSGSATWSLKSGRVDLVGDSVVPPRRSGFGVAPSALGSSVFIAGGRSASDAGLSDVWEWTGRRWVALPTLPSPAPETPALACTAEGLSVLGGDGTSRHWMLRDGGYGAAAALPAVPVAAGWYAPTNSLVAIGTDGGLWESTGPQWNQLVTQRVLDPKQGVVTLGDAGLFVGGALRLDGGFGSSTRVQAWDSSRWAPLYDVQPVIDNEDDGNPDAGVLVGNPLDGPLRVITNAGPSLEIWESQVSKHRPAILVTCPSPPGGWPTATYDRLSATGLGGGSSPLGDGLELQGWLRGAFVPAPLSASSETSADASVPANFSFTTTDARWLEQFTQAATPTLSLRPIGPNGSAFARLTLGDVTCTVRYRLQ